MLRPFARTGNSNRVIAETIPRAFDPMTDFLTPLSIETLRAAGIPDPWTYGQADRVRFYELDALNHVNNTAYLRWFCARSPATTLHPCS